MHCLPYSDNTPLSVPFFSIIIPTYNCANYLFDALISLQNQTFKDFEVIIADNHSTDGTLDIANSFTDLRITTTQLHNEGIIAKSRNTAANVATGQWLSFLDADDYWEPTKLQVTYDTIQTTDVEAVCHLLKPFGPTSAAQNMSFSISNQKDIYLQLIFKGNCFATSGMSIKHSIFTKLHGFPEDYFLATAEDYALWLSLAKYHKIATINHQLGHYRCHTASASSRLELHYSACIAATEVHLCQFDSSYPWQTNRRRYRIRFRFSNILLSKRFYKQALAFFMSGLYFLCIAYYHWRPSLNRIPDLKK